MTDIVFRGSLHVPVWINDLDSFRKWTLSDEFSDEGEIAFLGGLLWVDPSMERDIHNQIKTAITVILFSLVQAGRLGRFYGDKMRLVHPEAELSTEPDALFVGTESLQRQRLQLQQGGESLELLGSPDMVLEVVSPTSIQKDTVHLLRLYHLAGVREYWLVNPLGEQLDFRIYRHTAKKFTQVRSQGGWLRSTLFDKSFRLNVETNELRLSEYRLEMR